MDRNKFIDSLIDAGASDDEISEALQMAERDGVVTKELSGATGVIPEAGPGDAFMSAVAPRTSERALMKAIGAAEGGIGRDIATAASDVLSLPGRTAASIPALMPGGESFGEAMQRTMGKERTGFGNVAEFAGDIVRDPALFPAAAVGSKVASSLASLGTSALRRIGVGAVAGLGEGVVSAGVHQAENYGRTGKVDPKAAAAEVGVSAVGGGAFTGLAELLKKGSGLIKSAVSNFSEVPREALEEATDKGRREAARAAMRKTGGDLSRQGRELQDRVMQVRNEIDNIGREIEQMKADALTGEVGRASDTPSGIGSRLKETTQGAQKEAGARFERGQMDILEKRGAKAFSIVDDDGTNALQKSIDDFKKRIKFDSEKGYGKIGNRVIPEEAMHVLDGMYEQFGKAQTLEDAIDMRRLLDQKIDFGRDGKRLFERGSDADYAMTQIRNSFNDAIEKKLSEGLLGDTVAKAWRANNERYAQVAKMLSGVEGALNMGKTSSEEYAGRIANIGVDKLEQMAQLAQDDKVVKAVYDELRRGFKDNLILAGTDANGINFKKFSKEWSTMDPDIKRLMFDADDAARIDNALEKFAPAMNQKSTLGRGVLGVNPDYDRTARTLENIGSKANREDLRQLQFLDDILGNQGDKRISQLAQDTYLGKQLKMTPEGQLPAIGNIRTGKFNAGLGGGAAAGASLGSAFAGPVGAAVGAPIGMLAGIYLQSPAAAMMAYRLLGASEKVASSFSAQFAGREVARTAVSVPGRRESEDEFRRRMAESLGQAFGGGRR